MINSPSPLNVGNLLAITFFWYDLSTQSVFSPFSLVKTSQWFCLFCLFLSLFSFSLPQSHFLLLWLCHLLKPKLPSSFISTPRRIMLPFCCRFWIPAAKQLWVRGTCIHCSKVALCVSLLRCPFNHRSWEWFNSPSPTLFPSLPHLQIFYSITPDPFGIDIPLHCANVLIISSFFCVSVVCLCASLGDYDCRHLHYIVLPLAAGSIAAPPSVHSPT